MRPSSLSAVVHPNFVLRVAAESAGIVDTLSTGGAAAALERLKEAENSLRERIDALCARLFDLCRGDDCDAFRTDVIRLKRDIYNLRFVARDHAARILGPLAADLAGEADAVLVESEKVRAGREGLAALYDEEIRSGRQALIERLDSESIGVALQQANRQLHTDLMRLRDSGPAGFKPKDIDQLFLALQNYVLRAALKTSPRSTLTMFGVGAWMSSSAPTPLQFVFDDLRFRRLPRLNDIVVTKLLEKLIRDRKVWADQAVFALNGTVAALEDTVIWKNLLMETDLSGVTVGTQECRMELRRTRPIDLLLHEVHRLGGQGFPIGDLVAALRVRTPEPYWAMVDQLITEAVARGLIGPKLAGGSQTERLACMKGLLPDLQPETADLLSPRIEAIETALSDYADAPALGQTAALGKLRASFAALEGAIDSENSVVGSDPLIQEDSRIDAPPLSLDSRELSGIQDDLRLLIQAAPLYTNGWGGVRYWMADRFIEQFGETGVCPDVVAFLAPLFDKIMTAVSEPRGAVRLPEAQPIFDHRLASELTEHSRRFLSTLAAQRPEHGEMAIDRHWLERQIDALPAIVRNERRSHCINGQFLRHHAGQNFVVNAIYPGNGRMISRFLDPDPQGVARRREYLREISLAGRHLAVPGVFGMNANFHPQHADEELQLPPFPADYEQAGAVPIESLNLRYDPTRHNVFVCDRDGAPVDCFYFGILFSYRLPKIQFLIDALSGFSEAPPPIDRVLAGQQQNRDRISRSPRLTIGSIVAGRASWSAPSDLLPRADVAPAEFFYRLLDWYREHGLPRGVYFSSTQLKTAEGEGTPAMFKWRKPMFMDFENPMTVRPLQRLLRKSRAAVFFTEALPTRDETVVRSGNAHHVSEISFELSFVRRHQVHAAVH